MLVIRMQRTGRKGHAMFRVVVQDSRRTPTSGKIVAAVGSYDPHTKAVTLDKEKAEFYLTHGAQPSERVTKLLAAEGVKLPSWADVNTGKAAKLRHPEKLRRNRPAEAEPVQAPSEPKAEVAEEPAVNEAPAAEAAAPAEESATEAPAEEATEATTEPEAPTEEAAPVAEAPEEPAAAEEAPAEAPSDDEAAEKPAA